MTVIADDQQLDTLVPLSRLDEVFDPGTEPSYEVCVGWIRHGLKINKQVVKLRAVRLGKRWMLSRRIVLDFAERCAAASIGPRPQPRELQGLPSGRTRRRRLSEQAYARERLREDGLIE